MTADKRIAAMVAEFRESYRDVPDEKGRLRAFEHARESLVFSLRHPREPLAYRPYLGLGRFVVGRAGRARWESTPTPPPRGWRAMKVLHRSSWIVMPLWVYWPVRLWRERWRYTVAPFERIGFYQLREEGGYWSEGRFRYDFWNVFRERYERPLYIGPPMPRDPNVMVWGRMERIGRIIERHVARFNASMPRWT